MSDPDGVAADAPRRDDERAVHETADETATRRTEESVSTTHETDDPTDETSGTEPTDETSDTPDTRPGVVEPAVTPGSGDETGPGDTGDGAVDTDDGAVDTGDGATPGDTATDDRGRETEAGVETTDASTVTSADTRVEEVLETGRWTGIAAAALFPVGAGLVLRQPGLLLAGIVGVAVAAYARGNRESAVDVRVERTVSPSDPDPGEDVTVTVRVHNDGGFLADLRVIDGVPPALAVEGSARLGTALRSGRTAAFEYTVTAVRGEHDWEPVTVVARNASGSRETTARVDTPTTLRCHPDLAASTSLPLRGLTTQFSGRVPTDVGGSGLEFHATREYRHGDPVRRINWARLARTGELSTLEFREERAATVVLLVDARVQAYQAPGPEASNAVERAVEAATVSFSALSDTGDRVGVAAMSPDECWLAPGTGADHEAAARELFTSHPALSATPSEDRFLPTAWLTRFRRRIPPDAQVVFFSPVLDDFAVTVGRRLDAYGHAVTVVSPDPTTEESAGRQFARVERDNRLSELRGAGIRVVDWGAETALEPELERSARRWSR